MRITSKGQVTIPADIRERAGLFPNTEVVFVIEDGRVILRPADGMDRGERMVARLRGSGTRNLNMTTDELLELMRGPYDDVADQPVVREPPKRFVPK
jgi:AbrB family looped-hinge helix DNA binding protein